MKLIAIIPARVGSKRLPNKNFKEFFGKPIISYPLAECIASEMFDKIVISTNEKLGKTIQFLKYGGSPLLEINKRSNKLAGDDITIDQVVYHLLTTDFQGYDFVCVIYPTAYAVTWQDLCESFKNNACNYCFSVNMLNHDNGAELDNGGFYWARVKTFLERKTLLGDISMRYDLPMVDINTIHDFAEAKIHALTLRERFK